MLITTNRRKKILSVGALVLGFIAPVLAVNLSINPIYSEARFAPADKLHAGCINAVNINFDAQSQAVENVHAVVSYDPNDVQIIRVDSSTDDPSLVNYNIEYDRVVLNYLNPKNQSLNKKSLFTVYFKSIDTLTSSMMGIETGSYVLTQDSQKMQLKGSSALTFAKVAECDPDVLPPEVSLEIPKNNKDKLPLDTYFAFSIKDAGKGVDKSSVQINLGGEIYTANSEYFQRSGDYLFFYPKYRLPVQKTLSLTISLADKQVYGGPNTIKKEFIFTTADQVVFQNNISPASYRKIIQRADSVFASATECRLLKQIYAESDITSQSIFKNLFKKMSCDVTDLTAYLSREHDIEKVNAASFITQTMEKKVSVLSVLGWALFSIAFLLKVHYYLGYRKHKKLALALQEEKNERMLQY